MRLCCRHHLRQHYYCQPETNIATWPNANLIMPSSVCIDNLEQDCLEDTSDPSYLPADFAQCLTDFESRTCAEYDDFSHMDDFPASCENLRALDSGIGVQD